MFFVCVLRAAVVTSVACQSSFPWASVLSRTDWTVATDSSQGLGSLDSVVDGNASTFWPTAAATFSYIQIDMQRNLVVNGLSYQAPTESSHVGEHTVELSKDGTTWSLVAYGTFLGDRTVKYTFFSDAGARYVRLKAERGGGWAVSELYVYGPTGGSTPGLGRFDVTIDLPIVPASAHITSDNVVVFSAAFRPDQFSGGSGLTETVVWDPATRFMSRRSVTETQHDMFCPGISIDADGLVVVTGGNDAKQTSIYQPASGWQPAAQMRLGRGYQSSTTIADGRIFTIGGSWSGGRGGKHGEMYNSTADTWTLLPGASVAPMLTDDAGGAFRSDNHAWLFAWTGSSVFQAGPSRAMNWFHLSGNGSWTAAGIRADADAMCGNAVMFDAVNGLILTTGGSPSYQDSSAISDAHLIRLGNVDVPPTVTRLPGMQYARAFANAVVLPDGRVLVAGGQSYAMPFTDTNSAMPAELFDPATGTWTTAASIAEPRNYHSIGLLLPDATVLIGGGGLCGTGCAHNHFSAQVYSPPYLFMPDGGRATRPVIRSVEPMQLRPGERLTVTTDMVATFSLLRHGSSTHTVNTDQRRVPLTATASGLTYTVTLPSDPGVLLPGFWMLFALDAAGVPSLSVNVKVLLL